MLFLSILKEGSFFYCRAVAIHSLPSSGYRVIAGNVGVYYPSVSLIQSLLKKYFARVGDTF